MQTGRLHSALPQAGLNEFVSSSGWGTGSAIGWGAAVLTLAVFLRCAHFMTFRPDMSHFGTRTEHMAPHCDAIDPGQLHANGNSQCE